MIYRARWLATVKTPDLEVDLHGVPVGESPYSLLQQVNAALAQSYQPFMAWRPLPHYCVYQLILIADLALPSNWQLGM